MNVIKRSGQEVVFDIDKIIWAISRANEEAKELTDEQVTSVANNVWKQCMKLNRAVGVEEIQDLAENNLMKVNAYQAARHYVRYRYQKELNRKQNTTDAAILATVNLENEEVKQENSNKDPEVASVQRDYVAGLISRDLTDRYLLPKDVKEAHEEGIIHFHDSDYFIEKIHNCDLVDLEDIFTNGTVINGTKIETPKSFETACTIATQVLAVVASNQYGLTAV